MKLLIHSLFLGCLGITISIFGIEKWIVVTTIQYPTEQLRKLNKMSDWHLVVVGDRKTPSDWYLENCIYLSPSKQMELGYELASLLPWNHYSRKNIGYLYAIAQGADLIYETDDDNEPLELLNPLKAFNSLPSIKTDQSVVNMYAYFGQPEVWPRGYPLENFSSSEKIQLDSETSCHLAIEQGIVNGDPDVDAIYRLTQGKEVSFQARKSCFLPQGTFCPFNSQNTYFHRDAFFTLYLPSSVSMRVSDIWRGYIAQRLIWDIGLVVAFSGPNAYQKRNVHSLLRDFTEEYDLYTKSGALINFLSNWSSPSTSPFESMELLVDSMVENQFLKVEESTLIQAWFRDLKKAQNNYRGRPLSR
jgi:hypothetical protein